MKGSVLKGGRDMAKKSDLEQVAGELKKTLILAARQSRKAKVVSHDRMKNLSRLGNCYFKFLTATQGGKKPERDPLIYGDPDFVESLEKG